MPESLSERAIRGHALKEIGDVAESIGTLGTLNLEVATLRDELNDYAARINAIEQALDAVSPQITAILQPGLDEPMDTKPAGAVEL